MFKNLTKKKRSVGIQITDELVRFVSFRYGRNTMRTDVFGEEFLSKGIVTKGKITDPAGLTAVLRSIKERYDFKDVTVVLPEEQSFIFYTNVPQAVGRELQQVIQDHINSFLQLHSKVSVRDLVCEYDVLGEVDGNYEVQVTVTPTSLVETYVRVFENAGLNPKTLEVGSHMISQACVADSDGVACMMIDFGADRTHITTISDGRVIENGTLPVGHKHLSPVVQNFLNVNPHEAGRILKRHGVRRSHREPELLSELLYELAPIRDYVDRHYIDWHTRPYKNVKERNPIRKILLHGEGARLGGFLEHLTTSTRMPVEYVDVWGTVPAFREAIPDMHYADTFRYATAISAALYGMRM